MDLNDDRFIMKAQTANQSGKPFILGITGGTGAGKTTFARRLAKILATQQTVALIDLESYYKDFSFLSLHERQQVNFDDPASIDLGRLRQDLHRLKQGQAIVKPVYDLITHTRHAGGPVMVLSDIVIVEGLMLFVEESVCFSFDLRIYIDTPAEVRLRRRLERDVRERGHTLAGAIDHYMSSVLPMHDRFIEPTRDSSSFVIPGWEDTEHHLNEVVSVIRHSLVQNGNQSFTMSSQNDSASESFPEESTPKQEHTAG